MRRVLVLGCSGAGKSTFAQRLGAITGLPVVHLDQLFWETGWKQAPRDVFVARVTEAIAGDRWIIDGNSPSTLDLRLPLADRVVLLHRPRALCFWRIFKRVASTYGRVRADMAPGCPERIDLEFLRYVWRFPTVNGPQTDAILTRHEAWPRTTVLTHDREIEAFLQRAAMQ